MKLQINQQQECDAEHLLLEPDQQILCQFGLDMESMLILNGDKHDCTTVPVLNFNMDAKHLDKGQIVGKLYPVTLEGSELDESLAEVRALDTIDASPVDKSHWDKLCQVLRVTDVKSAAKPDAVSKLYDMLKLYANVFVLEDGQLGSTNVVTHSINTGDSPAFDRLKQLLIDSPLLVFPDFSRGFVMETDASGIGLGAVLAQEVKDGTLHPVAYAIQPHEQNYGATELEALEVVWATKHFRHYLYGHKCVIFTDHEALKSLLNTPHPSGTLARWGLILQDMELEIKYRSGKKNSNADALSRYPVSTPTEPLQDTSVTEVNGVVAALDSSREV